MCSDLVFPPRRPQLDFRAVNVEIVAEHLTLGWVFTKYFGFQARSHNCRKRLLTPLCLSVCLPVRMEQFGSRLYLYRARIKITQLLTPTYAQLRHRLKFIKKPFKTPTCFGLRPSSGSYNILAKVTII